MKSTKSPARKCKGLWLAAEEVINHINLIHCDAKLMGKVKWLENISGDDCDAQ